MQKDKLVVGTITANYNTGRFFIDCLAGLLHQHRKPDHVVVVDDGSPDNSWQEVCNAFTELTSVKPDVKGSNQTFKTNDIQFQLLQLDKNRGPSFARNVGLQYLVEKTDAICIADADDILHPGKISESIEVMKKYPNVALVYSDYDVHDMATNKIKREFKEIYSFKRLFERCIVSNNSVIASKVINMVGGYDDSLRGGEDYDLWLRIAEVAAVYHIPESLYTYRLTGVNSTVVTPKEKFALDVQKVHQKAIARRERSMKHGNS